MSTELHALRNVWQTTSEPNMPTRAAARARLFEEIDGEAERVLGREPLTPRHRLQSRRSLGLVLAAVVVLFLLVVVAFTFGLGLPVLDFGKVEKAPSESRVVKNFALLDQGAPPGMATDVIPNETRKVATFGTATLWVAPTRQGGFCTDLGGVGGCDRLGTVPLNVSWAIERSGPSRESDKVFGGLPVDQVSGYVNARWAAALEIRFEDGNVIKPQVTWVSKPIEAGFFVQPIPLAQRGPGHLISAIVALDRDGELVTSDSLDLNRFGTPPSDAILDRAKQVAVIETGDGPAVLRSAPTRYEGRCTWLEFGSQQVAVVPCLPKGYEQQPALVIAVHALGGALILAGECGYSAVEFLHPDGGARRVDCADGLVFTELTPADAAGQVRALDRKGRPLLGSTVPVSRLRER